MDRVTVGKGVNVGKGISIAATGLDVGSEGAVVAKPDSTDELEQPVTNINTSNRNIGFIKRFTQNYSMDIFVRSRFLPQIPALI